MVAHSPLPWSVGGRTTANVGLERQIVSADGRVVSRAQRYTDEPGHLDRNDADAEFIVRAVNNHKELLAALKGIVEMNGPSTDYSHQAAAAWANCEAAIEKAERR